MVDMASVTAYLRIILQRRAQGSTLACVSMTDFMAGLSDLVVPVFRRRRAMLEYVSVEEKSDGTFLTSVDVEIQEIATRQIYEFDPGARIVAEEESEALKPSHTAQHSVWVIDPIDGTAQFVRPEATEFCFALALLRDGWPSAVLIVAPELGPDRTPLVIIGEAHPAHVSANGIALDVQSQLRRTTGTASATRSRGAAPSDLELRLQARGFDVKTKTTSQSIDMMRTALDLPLNLNAADVKFDAFYRESQKAWDGVPGLCLGHIVGMKSRHERADDTFPIDFDLLDPDEPVFSRTLMFNPIIEKDVEDDSIAGR